MKFGKTMFFCAALLAATVSSAEVKLPRVFSDGAVLQCGKPLKIWGWASPDSEISVSFAGKSATARAGKAGEWSVQLPPLPASKTPRKIEIAENGRAAKAVSDVLVGEVWVLAGQSNMAWPLLPTTDGKAATERANYPTVRCFKKIRGALPDTFLERKFGTFERTSLCSLDLARTPQKDSPEGSVWRAATPKNVPLWSAIGFYFAEKLADDLDVPVGLVFTPLGGSPMAAWIPESACAGNGFLEMRKKSHAIDMRKWDSGGYEKALAEYSAKVEKRKSELAEWKRGGKKPENWGGYRAYVPPSKDSPFSASATPFYNFNAKVAPLAGYAARGILWYQGESDARGASLDAFESQLETVVRVWRECFADPNLPFIQAQLSSYGKSANWAEVRAAQLAVSERTENMYTVCTLDIGDKNDVHPRNKTDVGLRMERVAMACVYGKRGASPLSPIFENAKFGGASAEVSVDSFGRGLKADGALRGFEASVGGKWVAADAAFDGGKIVVSSRNGGKIDGVRYLWKQYPQDDVCLRNSDGLPLFPFSVSAK